MRKAVLSLFMGGLLGKAIGFLREMLLARFFGTTSITDSYRAAFAGIFIPMNFMTADALNAGFIPLYQRYKTENSEHKHLLFWSLSFALGAISIILTALVYFGADAWTRLLVPGFGPEARRMTIEFLQVMALGIPFYIQASMASYLEMGNGIYWQFSMRASVQSIAFIAGTVAAFYLKRPMYLAWGFTLCYMVLCVGGWCYLAHKKLLVWPQTWRLADIREIQGSFWTSLWPLLPLPIFLQGNIAVERAISSLLGTGVVASLEYARIITETGVILIAGPIGMAGLSHLSAMKFSDVRDRMARMLPLLLAVLVSASTLLFVHSSTVVKILFARGAFNADSVRVTSLILSGLALGFWAQVVGYVLLKALNAQLRNRDVLGYSVAGLLVNGLCNVLAYRLLGPACLGIAASLNGLLVFTLALRSFGLWPQAARDLLRLSAGVAIYVAAAKFLEAFVSAPGLFGLGVGLVYWLLYFCIVKAYRTPFAALLLGFFPQLRPIPLVPDAQEIVVDAVK